MVTKLKGLCWQFLIATKKRREHLDINYNTRPTRRFIILVNYQHNRRLPFLNLKEVEPIQKAFVGKRKG